MTLVKRTSMYSGKEHTMDLPTTVEKLTKWFSTPRHELPYIQDMFPELNAGEREFILTGCTPEEWNAMFPEEEEYE